MQERNRNMASSSVQERFQRRRSSVFDFEHTIMFGQYREDLANFALSQAEKAAAIQNERQAKKPERTGECVKLFRKVFNFGGDFIFYGVLAGFLAFLSFIVDIVVHACYDLRGYLTETLAQSYMTKLLFWILFMMTFVILSALITRLVAPQAAGSGVAEMKVILRGAVLKEYLTFKTLITKIVGVALTLGSGLPMGKEGPFVHIAAASANQFMKVFANITSPQEFESRFFEVIAVACGVGVAVTFASPVGGVLYSIEIVSVFFSVRSYWHGFFAATCGALFWRLLTVWFNFENNITHIFHTAFRLENPFETTEIISFALLGILCGLAANLFVIINKNIVLFNRRKNKFNSFIQKFPMLYPILLSAVIGFLMFPPMFGKYFASYMSAEQIIHELFSNYSWSTVEDLVDHDEIIDHWKTGHTSIFFHTFMAFVMNMLIIAVAATIPMPSGLIVPSFRIGACFGRFYGELMAYWFPTGLNPFYKNTQFPILAGAYAVAGSAAFTGANTGALSSAVIAFEMTGQLTHLLPVIVAVLASTITARMFGPSIYDSLIILKKLPYLPYLLPSSSSGHKIFVEDFMEKELLFVWKKCTYRYLRHVLTAKKRLRIFPFVKSPESMILLGTIERSELQAMLDTHLNRQRMLHEIRKSMQSLHMSSQSPPPANCPVHGTGTGSRRFQVESIPENEELSITAIGTSAWEEDQLDQIVDFSVCAIDPAPFQLMEGSSLYKVHNLFHLLGLQLAYVTTLGSLVGVVGLKELRKAITDLNSGATPKREPQPDANGENIDEESGLTSTELQQQRELNAAAVDMQQQQLLQQQQQLQQQQLQRDRIASPVAFTNRPTSPPVSGTYFASPVAVASPTPISPNNQQQNLQQQPQQQPRDGQQ